MLVAFVFALALSACGGASAEDLIRADLESYFGDPENAAEEFASGLEASAGDELDMLGITEDEFTEAYLEGFAYEIGEITSPTCRSSRMSRSTWARPTTPAKSRSLSSR